MNRGDLFSLRIESRNPHGASASSYKKEPRPFLDGVLGET